MPSPLERRALADPPYGARGFSVWIRARLVEHWRGDHRRAELDRNDFGLLRRPIHAKMLVADIVALVLSGAENLDIFTWAVETDQPLDAWSRS